jgi:hypothetical protein
MSPEQELQTLSNLVLFLKRTQLSGEEVIAFNQSMAYLGERQRALAGAAEAMKKQELDTPPAEE